MQWMPEPYARVGVWRGRRVWRSCERAAPTTGGSRMQQLDPRDSVFLYVENEVSKQIIVSAYVFAPDGNTGSRSDRNEIGRWIADRVAGIDLLRQRLVHVPFGLDHPYWVDDPDFSLENHLVFHEGSEWDEVCTVLAATLVQPMDGARPLWELHVFTDVRGIEGVEGAATVAALKTHHAIADGMLSAQLGRHLFGSSPATPDDPHPVAPREPLPSGFELLVRAVRSAPGALNRLVSGLPGVRSAQRELALRCEQGQYTSPVAERPRTVFNRPLGPDRVFGLAVFPLAELRAMKAELGDVTINDLALAVIGGAMRKYLDEAGESPDGSLAAGVPMSTRAARHQVSRNQFVTMAVDLHTDIVNPVERARAIHRSALDERARKSSPESIRSDEFVQVIPGFAIRAGLWMLGRLPARERATVGWGNTLITNVPKGAADLKLCDSSVAVTFSLCALVGPSGLGHWVDSVGDILTINVTADPRQLRDDDRYVELLRGAYAELESAIMNGAKA
ncbi:wax ester/triacylglycerol synthase domain-containing protein [Rhodococcus daqingensis]|uniref:diacylglycerol O-acyltransferase n=1 Tax=Rhodococcus daqingensis TaxID=2479363 RepID=A0ABW2RU42_9NOCA